MSSADQGPYSQRPEWADLSPLPVADDAGKVVAIQYSQQHKEHLGYFRAILAKGEKSERVLQLTADMINRNSADYTAWQHRWDTLSALKADMQQECVFTAQVAEDSIKNYQLWNHRRKIALALGPAAAEQELQFCAEALDADSKNYHAWAHRQVVVAAAGAWQPEMEYLEGLLLADVRNNSAWNQRAFVIRHTLDAYSSLQELLDQELLYVAEQIQRAPDNESAWNYLWGLFSLSGCRQHEMGRQDKVFTICKEALSDCPSCKPALDTLVEFYACLAAAAAAQGDATSAGTAAKHGLMVLSKAAVADPMRENYWKIGRTHV